MKHTLTTCKKELAELTEEKNQLARRVEELELVIDFIEPALGPASDDVIEFAREDAAEEMKKR